MTLAASCAGCGGCQSQRCLLQTWYESDVRASKVFGCAVKECTACVNSQGKCWVKE